MKVHGLCFMKLSMKLSASQVELDDHHPRDPPKTMTTSSEMKLTASHVAIHEFMHEVPNCDNRLVGLRVVHGNPDSI